MAKQKLTEVEKDNSNDGVVKITKDCLSIYRKKSELDEYLNDGWVVTE